MTAPVRHAGRLGLTRLRLGVLAAMYVVLGAASGGVFDRFVWTLIVVPLLPIGLVWLTARRSVWTRSAAAVGGVLVAIGLAVAVAGGTAGDVATVFASGVRRLLSTEWPSPYRPVLVGTVAGGLAVGAALSAVIASARRWHLLPLLPVTLTYISIIALSSPLGVRPWSLAVICLLAFVFATLHDEGSGLRDRWLFLRGERRLLVVVVLVAIVAAAVSIPVAFTARADPRQEDPATDTAPLLDPIEATLALRGLDPPIDLHEVSGTAGTDQWPARWRTAALGDYDGRRWTPTLTLRPIGNTLGPVTGPTVDADISFLRDDLSLVPLPGPPVSVDADVETDTDRTIVRLTERPEPGDVVGVVANITPDLAGVDAPVVAVREVDENVAGLTGLAETLGGADAGTVLIQLEAIETTMREDYVLETEAPAGGLQRALIDRFLRDTRRGNTQQFATAFVLLARSLGVDARVATGFEIEPSASDAPITLSSADAAIWPEVRLEDGSWIAFDPVPEEEASDNTPPVPQPEVQTPAAPQPPVAPPPEVDSETPETETETDTADTDWSEAEQWAVRIGIGAGIFLLPLVLAVGVILLVKRRRRRRRLRADRPADRIRGAWASATDDLVDAGLSIPSSSTDREIAVVAEPYAPGARRELHRLALLNGAATFGSPTRPDLLAQDAAACLASIDGSLGTGRTRWQRVRRRLSLRSLRSTTRSPVRA